MTAGKREVIRIHIGPYRDEARRWFRSLGFFISSDNAGYAAISRHPSLARRVLEVDSRPGRHTAQLGQLLGYPACCARAAARVGDEGIDQLADDLLKRRFRGRYRAIDPKSYLYGGSLLSHVPCTPWCRVSLNLACTLDEETSPLRQPCAHSDVMHPTAP